MLYRDGMVTGVETATATATVLVVEDEPLVRMMVCELLDDAGYRVEEAESGDEADALIAAGLHPDILLTDIRMPGTLDGFDLIRRTVARLPRVKTIAMSGYTGVSGDARIADRFLSKPFRPTELQREVAELLAARAG